MERRKQSENSVRENPMKKRRFCFTFYSVAVLIVLLIVALNSGIGGESFLFDKNSPITLYAQTETGVKPEFDAAAYFPETELDSAKFRFDWEGCDLSRPGTYLIPVFYDGKETACVLSLRVREPEGVDRPLNGTDGELQINGNHFIRDGAEGSDGPETDR